MKENSEGGFLIPQTAYVDVIKPGRLWIPVRWIGQQFIYFGAWLRSFGYTKKEIHPHAEIMKAIEKYGVVRP